MNIFAIIVMFIGCIEGKRLQPKGNMRGITVDFSSLSPRQAEMIRRLIKQNRYKKYGRFASQLC